jgi:signal transduction histidine kinase
VRKRLFLIASIILFGNGLLGYLVYKSNSNRIRSGQWVQHSMQVNYQAERLLLEEANIRTALRGYLITGDSSLLSLLNITRKTMLTDVNQLAKLTRDNPSQHQRSILLSNYINEFLGAADKTTGLKTNRISRDAKSGLFIKEMVYSHSFEKLINLIRNEEENLLKERTLRNDRDSAAFTRSNTVVFIFLGGFTILLLVVTRILIVQHDEKNQRAGELTIANEALDFENDEKNKRAGELVVAKKELFFQRGEKKKRAEELLIANMELVFQNQEKEKRANELIIANKELVFQNQEKENRAAELVLANKELLFQSIEKEKRAEELILANIELSYQNSEKEKRAVEQGLANIELIFQNKVKEKMAAERTKMVNDLMVRNQDLEQFAYIISHNLRAPVANIIGASNALSDPELTIADKNILNEGINKSVMKLDNVVKDLNYILEAKNDVYGHKETVTFSELVDDIKNSINGQIDTSGITLTCDFTEVDQILTLKPYMYSIFYNLISNSVKYVQKDKPGIIQIKSCKTSKGIELIFTDNGMGIDLVKKGTEVFGLYKRFHDHIEGKGMGLYMVKTQVEALGGQIHIQSAVNKGCEFKVKFNRLLQG